MIKTTKKKDGTEKTVYVCDCCGKTGTDPHFTKTVKVPQYEINKYDIFNQYSFFNSSKKSVDFCQSCYDRCFTLFTDEMVKIRTENWKKKYPKKAKLFP